MRAWLLVALITAGCVGSGSSQSPAGAGGGLDVYAFSFPGDGGYTPGSSTGIGWLFRVHNAGPAATVLGCTTGIDYVQQGPTQAGWQIGGGRAATPDGRAGWCGLPFALEHNESVAYLVQAATVTGDPMMRFYRDGAPAFDRRMAADATAGTQVTAGMHVQTRTVGVWQNGTSFYTNIPALLEDPRFPAGGNIVREDALAGAQALAIYVYDQDRGEQPPASRDTCHGTTIAGYNALLKSQSEGSTAVRYVFGQEAYTRPGSEAHLLYGDDVVFLNTVVAIDATTDPTYVAPETFGACYDVQNTADYLGIEQPLRLG